MTRLGRVLLAWICRGSGLSVLLLLLLSFHAWGAERLGPSSRRTGLTFSEILQNPDPSTPGGTSEFVELYNGDILPVSLQGFRLDGSIRFVFPAQTTLSPGAALVVARDPSALRSRLPGATLLGPYEGALAGRGFHLELYDEFGALLLETRLDADRLPSHGPKLPGHSLVLQRPSLGEGMPRAWGWSQIVGGTPGQLEPTPESEPPDSDPTEAASPAAPVVIHEILFHPVTGNDREQFIELYNRTDREVSLEGWHLEGAVEFAFPRTARIPPHGYVVVARDARNLRRSHAALHRGNCMGDFTGALSHSGGTLRLLQPAAGGDGWKIVHEARYRAGGRWGVWADGGGSSLELIHPDADARRADSWRESDESLKAPWTTLSFHGRVGQGIGLGAGTSLHLYLLGEGECLVDDVEVRVEGGTNRVANPGFEAGLAGWRAMGAMDLSSVEPDASGGSGAGQVLHLRAGSRGDPGANKVVSESFARVAEGDWVTIRCRARWLRGWPELLLRLQGGGAEAAGRLPVPADPGTPGRPNSRAVAAAGPALWDVRQEPCVPDAGQPVQVSVAVESGRPVERVVLRYRVDPGFEWREVPMQPALAGGRFVAPLPGQPAGTLLAFHILAVGSHGATNTFPRELFPRSPLPRLFPGDSLSHECLVRFGDPRIPGALATYRLWMTRANRDRWIARDRLSNADLDATLVYDDQRVIHNVGAQAAGSPWHVDQMAPGPDGTNRFDYVVHLPKDEPLLGETDLNLVIPGNGDGPSSSDLSALCEPVSLLVFRDLGLPSLHRRFIRLVVNGSERSAVAGLKGHFVYEDVQQPNSHALRGWFPGVGHGTLFKIEDWFEFTNSVATVFENKDADLLRRVIPGTTNLSTAPYRFMWRLRGLHPGESANDYRPLFELIQAISPDPDPRAPVNGDAVAQVADFDQWLRVMACQRALGNWDSYGWERGKNCYLFRPPGGRFVLVPWDVDATLALGGREPDSDLFAVADPRLEALLAVPRWRRSYIRSLLEVLEGPLRPGRLEAAFDQWTTALHDAGVDTEPTLTEANKGYLKLRRGTFAAALSRYDAPFVVKARRTEGGIVLQGTAAPRIASIQINGRTLPVRWDSVTEWEAAAPLASGKAGEVVELVGEDRFGHPVTGARTQVTAF